MVLNEGKSQDLYQYILCVVQQRKICSYRSNIIFTGEKHKMSDSECDVLKKDIIKIRIVFLMKLL